MKNRRCTSRAAIDSHDKWAQECMRKYGFYTHFVYDKDFDNSPSGVNLHTHGFEDSANHVDFQITIPLKPEVANEIFHELFKRVLEGWRAVEGAIIPNIIGGGMNVSFLSAMECGRPVLRVILPDPNGHINSASMMPRWRNAQYGDREAPARTVRRTGGKRNPCTEKSRKS